MFDRKKGFREHCIRLLMVLFCWTTVLSCAAPTPERIYVTAPPSSATPPVDWRVVRIVETVPSRFEIIDVSKILARNCVGPSTLRYWESVRKTSTVETTIGGGITFGGGLGGQAGGDAGLEAIGISVGVAASIAAALEAHLHITNGQEIEKEQGIEVEVKPGDYLVYQLVWKEVWTDGYVVIERTDGTQKEVSFEVRRSLQGEMVDPIDIGCDE